MRWLKNLAMFVVVLALFLVALAYLMPAQWHVERTAVVNAPPEVIYAKVADLRQWRQWTIWYLRNPQLETRYEGPASGVGAVSEWRDAQGTGRLIITAAEANRQIAYDLLFDGEMLTRGSIVLAPDASGTRVTWTFDGDAGLNPVKRYFGILVTRRVGDDFDAGLATLKRVSEDDARRPD